MEKIRVATLQYFIRPVESFQGFVEQVQGLVETAADYGCRLVVFPEYFTLQLLSLGDARAPMRDQVRGLAREKDRLIELFSRLARHKKIYIVAGTFPVLSKDEAQLFNESFVFGPSGSYDVQGKLHMTRFEKEEWLVSPHSALKVFETDFGKMGINICYDVEFPELARSLAHQGVNVLVVPSCTDERQGFLRVRYCAQARAIENQLYVVHSGTTGSLPTHPAVALNYAQASILSPSDFAFSRDGIVAEGVINQEAMVMGELNFAAIEENRAQGTVLPLRDSFRTREFLSGIQTVKLN